MGRGDEEVEPADRARRLAYAAVGCGKELSLTPSKTLDMQLTQGEFSTIVSVRLGVDVMEGG